MFYLQYWKNMFLQYKRHLTDFRVFVQCFWAFCHCGPQSAVIHSRVCHFSRRHCKIHLFLWVFCWQTKRRLRCLWIFIYKYQELWSRSHILPIPLKIVYKTAVVTGQSHVVASENMPFRRQWLYCVSKGMFCMNKMQLLMQLLIKWKI